MADPKNENLGCGIILVLAGVVIRAQRMGWVQVDIEWLFPLALIAWGLFYVLKALRK